MGGVKKNEKKGVTQCAHSRERRRAKFPRGNSLVLGWEKRRGGSGCVWGGRFFGMRKEPTEIASASKLG